MQNPFIKWLQSLTPEQANEITQKELNKKVNRTSKTEMLEIYSKQN